MSTLTTKRFVIRKSLIGNNTIITFTNKKDETYTYDHDAVYSANQEKLESWNVSRSIQTTQIVITYQHGQESLQCKNCDTCHLLYFT